MGRFTARKTKTAESRSRIRDKEVPSERKPKVRKPSHSERGK